MERSFQVKNESIPGPALDHRKSSILVFGIFNSIDFNIISLEAMAKSNELNAVRIGFILDCLKPSAVIQTDFIVAED